MIRWATGLIGKAGAPLAAKVGIGLVAVIALQAGAFAVQTWRLTNAQQQIGAQEQQLAQCQADNQAQTEHLRILGGEIQRITGEIEIQESALQAARLEAERLARARDRASAAEADARAEIYREDPDCESWALGMVCTDIAERLRERRLLLIGRWEAESDG